MLSSSAIPKLFPCPPPPKAVIVFFHIYISYYYEGQLELHCSFLSSLLRLQKFAKLVLVNF